MRKSVEVAVFDVLRNARGETVINAEPNYHSDAVRVGDVFLWKYEISPEDARSGNPHPARLNLRKISLRVVRIEIEHRGLNLMELPGAWGAAGELHVVGTGLEELTPRCLICT